MIFTAEQITMLKNKAVDETLKEMANLPLETLRKIKLSKDEYFRKLSSLILTDLINAEMKKIESEVIPF